MRHDVDVPAGSFFAPGEPGHLDGDGATPRGVAACLFGLSFGSSLFALSIFKLLSFFVMPSFLFDLLFVGFPLGAMFGARLGEGRRTVERGLWLLQGMMAGTIALGLLAKRLDYLRAHLFDVELPQLIAQVLAFAGLSLPFFAAYGLCEFLGYRFGRRSLGGRMRSVYAVALFGAAASCLFLKTCLPTLGMARVLLCAFAAVAVATLQLAGKRGRIVVLAELAVIGMAAVLPGSERAFLALYKGRGAQSTWDFEQNHGCRTVFQKWGRYSLTEIMADPRGANFFGFYNDMFQWEYSPRRGFTGPSLGTVPLLRTHRGDRIAIIGAGGGRQVRLAERLGGRRIVAIEIEPAVFEAVRDPACLGRAFGRVYEASCVTPVLGDARAYFERSTETFDLIYLPSVGGYAQMMIEPGDMVRTLQAYRLLRDHLTPRGVLAIWYPRGLDHRGVLTAQYVRTLRSLGLSTSAFTTDDEYLVLGARDREARPPSIASIREMLRLRDDPDSERFVPTVLDVPDDPAFRPITDERPFLAGNVRHILSIGQVSTLFGLATGTLALAGLLGGFLLRHRGDPAIRDRSFGQVAVLSLLIGANFLVVEHLLVMALFRRTYVYEDSLTVGAIAFLTLSGLGSFVAGRWPRRVLVAVGAASLLAFPFAVESAPIWGMIVLIAPAAVATGSFFPSLFERAARNPLAVFALDSIGAGLGAAASTFVPILFGFHAFFVLAAAIFSLTALADARFHRGLADDPSPERPVSGGPDD